VFYFDKKKYIMAVAYEAQTLLPSPVVHDPRYPLSAWYAQPRIQVQEFQTKRTGRRGWALIPFVVIVDSPLGNFT